MAPPPLPNTSLPIESERPKLCRGFGELGDCSETFECLRGEDSFSYGNANERSMLEGRLLCLGVLGDEGIVKVCVKE